MSKWAKLKEEVLARQGLNFDAKIMLNKVLLELIADAERASEVEEPRDNLEEIWKELNTWEDDEDWIGPLKRGLAEAVLWIADQEKQWERTGNHTGPQRYFYWKLLEVLRGNRKTEIPTSSLDIRRSNLEPDYPKAHRAGETIFDILDQRLTSAIPTMTIAGKGGRWNRTSYTHNLREALKEAIPWLGKGSEARIVVHDIVDILDGKRIR